MRNELNAQVQDKSHWMYRQNIEEDGKTKLLQEPAAKFRNSAVGRDELLRAFGQQTGLSLTFLDTRLKLSRAEVLQAPVMTTFDGKSAFPEDHALALGPGGGTFTGPGGAFIEMAVNVDVSLVDQPMKMEAEA